jgi:hypothetical protein
VIFQPTDAFMLGMGADLAGAYLLARGVLATDRQIARSGATFWGWNAQALVDKVEDRVNAKAGVAALLTGFSAQALGYTLGLAGWRSPAGLGSLVAALAFCATGFAVTLILWRWRRKAAGKRGLVAVARVDATTGEPCAHPSADVLFSLGMTAGWPGEMVNGLPESRIAYCARVFGVAADHRPEPQATWGDIERLVPRWP